MEVWQSVDNVDPLPDDQFWELISLIEDADLKNGNADLSGLKEHLTDAEAEAIAGFEEALARKVYALDTRQHYRAFSWFPSLSDTFYYARLGVVAMGKENYAEVLQHPKRFPKRGKL